MAMRAFLFALLAIATVGVSGCARQEPAKAPATTPTTTSAPLGPGYSGTTEHGATYSPDGTPYQGNVDPASPASNRQKHTPEEDVRKVPNAK
jgi:hypothetical protein